MAMIKRQYVRKFLRPKDAEVIYSFGANKILELADEAGAIYRIGNYTLINREILNGYLEQFLLPADTDSSYFYGPVR